MPGQIRLRPQAATDAEECAVYLGKQDYLLADCFLYALEQSLALLCRYPRAGKECQLQTPMVEGLRNWYIPGFPNYLVFYRLTDVGIEVVRILHGARDLPSIFANDTEV